MVDETTSVTTVAVSIFSVVVALITYLVFTMQPKGESAIGRCILITGCDSGIGALLTECATKAGYTVVAARLRRRVMERRT